MYDELSPRVTSKVWEARGGKTARYARHAACLSHIRGPGVVVLPYMKGDHRT